MLKVESSKFMLLVDQSKPLSDEAETVKLVVKSH